MRLEIGIRPDAGRIGFVRPVETRTPDLGQESEAGSLFTFRLPQIARDGSPESNQIEFTLGSWGRQEVPRHDAQRKHLVSNATGRNAP